MKGKWKKNPYICGGLALFCALAAFYIFYKLISDFAGITKVFAVIGDVLMPFIVGLVLAYLLAPVFDLVQKATFRLFAGKQSLPRRFAKPASKVIASAASVLFLIGIVVGLLLLVIPQAISSFRDLINSLPERSEAIILWIKQVGDSFGDGETLMNYVLQGIDWATNSLMAWAQNDLLPNLDSIARDFYTGIMGMVDTIINVIIGVIICVYTLNSKELFAAQAKKVTYSLCKTSTANYILHLVRYIDQTFGRFINGMLIDALMVGVLCFIGMAIFQMPYAPLVATIVGVFNIVPVFGPIIAAVIGFFFVCIESPLKAVFFLVFVLVLQQIDGNIVAPKILGNQTGLSSFWVIFAIIIGGGLFGFAGMIFGVPAFAVVYALFQQKVTSKLRKKSIPDMTEVYDGLWEIDELTGEPKYEVPKDELNVPDRRKHHPTDDNV